MAISKILIDNNESVGQLSEKMKNTFARWNKVWLKIIIEILTLNAEVFFLLLLRVLSSFCVPVNWFVRCRKLLSHTKIDELPANWYFLIWIFFYLRIVYSEYYSSDYYESINYGALKLISITSILILSFVCMCVCVRTHTHQSLG